MVRVLVSGLALLALSCASAPSVAPDASAAWGYVQIVPREGVSAASGDAAYGDRRLAGVRLVDYSSPGFVVVYADGAPTSAGGSTRLLLRDRATGPRFEPELAAVAVEGTIEVRNETAAPQVVSARENGRLVRIEPGDAVTFPASGAGEHHFSLLSAANVDARVFAAPGPFTVASESGRFELAGLPPGRHRLVAWHPRLPATAHWIDLSAGETRRLDIEIGVDRPHEVGR
jgi:hypothetical protein